MVQGGIALATVLIAAISTTGLIYAFFRPRLVSLLLILILAADWGVAAALAGLPGGVATDQILFIPPLFWSGAEPQAILLSVFVHYDLFHLVFNCIALYIFGVILEEKHGSRLLIGIFLLAGFLGNLAFAVVKPAEPAILLGASGGVMGVIGALARLSPQERITVFGLGVILPNVRMWVAAVVFASIDLGLAIAAEYAQVQMLGVNTRVAYVAHLGGLAAGLLLAPLLARLSVATKVTKVESSGIEELVPGARGKEIAAALKGETDPEIIAAWMKRLEEIAKCAECGNGMKIAGRGRFRCDAGHERKIGR